MSRSWTLCLGQDSLIKSFHPDRPRTLVSWEGSAWTQGADGGKLEGQHPPPSPCVHGGHIAFGNSVVFSNANSSLTLCFMGFTMLLKVLSTIFSAPAGWGWESEEGGEGT